MRVERVSFTGFRSLRDLTVEFGDVTVITGPNNAGKSNALAGLAFVGDVFARGLDPAMQAVGGYDNIAFRRAGEPIGTLAFDVTITLSAAEINSIIDLAKNTLPSLTTNAQAYEFSLRFTVDRLIDGPAASYSLGRSGLRLAAPEGDALLDTLRSAPQ